MNRLFPSLVGAAMLVASAAVCAQTPNTAANMHLVNLQASGQMEVAQDWLTIVLGVTRDGADAAQVQNQLRQIVEPALNQARAQVAAGQLEVRTGNLAVYPRHGRDGRITAWVGSAEIVIEGRDFARIGALAGRLQGLAVTQTAFSLSRDQRLAVEEQVQAQAIERFKAQAQSVARSFGFAGYMLREVTVSGSDSGPMPPRPRVMAMEARSAAMADAPVPVEAGKSTVQVTVSGAVQLTR